MKPKKKPTKPVPPPSKEDQPKPTKLLAPKEVAARLSVSVFTLKDWREKTPKRYTVETMKLAAERGEPIYLPFLRLGTTKNAAVRYEEHAVELWIRLQPHWGQLPEEVA
jgi:hypothetical protein